MYYYIVYVIYEFSKKITIHRSLIILDIENTIPM